MCSPVEHYICLCLFNFLQVFMKSRMFPGKKYVPRKNSFRTKFSFRRCPPGKVFDLHYATIIGVPGKVVYLYFTTVYCACLSVVLVAFRSWWNLAGWLPCWERASPAFCSACVVSLKYFVVFYVFSFPPGVYVGTLNLIASIPGPSIEKIIL